MITLIREFRDGMLLVRVRTGDGSFFDCFQVTKGLRQGGKKVVLLSPLLFNLFFAAALEVELELDRNNGDPLWSACRGRYRGIIYKRRRCRLRLEIARRTRKNDEFHRGSDLRPLA